MFLFLEKYNKIETLSNPILLQFCKNNLFQISPYLNPDILYTLKMSHMFWDINWEKHMFDIHFLDQWIRKRVYDLQLKMSTLDSLVRLGKAEVRVDIGADFPGFEHNCTFYRLKSVK